MRPATLSSRSAAHSSAPDAGGVLAGFLLAVLVVALVGAAAFYYFGGRADVDVKIKKTPNITVSGSPSPS
jgi:hypothetical protein